MYMNETQIIIKIDTHSISMCVHLYLLQGISRSVCTFYYSMHIACFHYYNWAMLCSELETN